MRYAAHSQYSQSQTKNMNTMSTTDTSPMLVLERMFFAEMTYMKSGHKDIAILATAFHPDVVVHEPSSLPYCGDWNGLHGVAALLRQMDRCFSNMRVQDLQCTGTEAHLYVSCNLFLTARATGITINQPFVEILSFANGLLVEGRPYYFDTTEIGRALGNEYSTTFNG